MPEGKITITRKSKPSNKTRLMGGGWRGGVPIERSNFEFAAIAASNVVQVIREFQEKRKIMANQIKMGGTVTGRTSHSQPNAPDMDGNRRWAPGSEPNIQNIKPGKD